MRAIYRYVVPVNDLPHLVELTGPIVHIATRNKRHIEFWAIVGDHEPAVRTFQVYATGQQIPAKAEYLGTALAPPDGQLVWHLFEHTGAAS